MFFDLFQKKKTIVSALIKEVLLKVITSFVIALTAPNTLILLRHEDALINSMATHHNAQIKGCKVK